MAFRVWEEDGLGQVMFDWMSGDWRARGAETAILLPADGQPHTWSFRYEPDARADPEWHDKALERLITDPREWELPDVGLLMLADPETGRRVEVQTADPKLRARFAAAATQRRREHAEAIRRSGAAHLALSTDRDWMRDVVVFAATHKGMLRK